LNFWHEAPVNLSLDNAACTSYSAVRLNSLNERMKIVYAFHAELRTGCADVEISRNGAGLHFDDGGTP